MTCSEPRGQRILTRSSSSRASAACSRRAISSVSSSVATPEVGGDNFLGTEDLLSVLFTQFPRHAGDDQNMRMRLVHPKPDHDVALAYGLETAFALKPNCVRGSAEERLDRFRWLCAPTRDDVEAARIVTVVIEAEGNSRPVVREL